VRSSLSEADFRDAINAVKFVNENIFVTGDDLGVVKVREIPFGTDG
jgi:enolase